MFLSDYAVFMWVCDPLCWCCCWCLEHFTRLENVFGGFFSPEFNVFYLVPLFPRFSCFTFYTFVALGTYREHRRRPLNIEHTTFWDTRVILAQRKTLCYSPSCQEGQGVQGSQVDKSLNTKQENKSQKISMTSHSKRISPHNLQERELYQVSTA